MIFCLGRNFHCSGSIFASLSNYNSVLGPVPTATLRRTLKYLTDCRLRPNNDSSKASCRPCLKMPSQVSNRRTITISVDGNISSGKSTLVSNLKELFPTSFNCQVELVPEPLEKWTNVQGHNLLGLFYEDLTKHNFMFQHYVQLTRLMNEIKKPVEPNGEGVNQLGQTATVRILERSLQSNRYCFTELARREGRLQPEEFAVLSEWHSWLETKFDITLDAIVYLRTDPQTVYNRMQKRGRSEESSVPMDYLRSLHETYENWLIRERIGSNVTTKEDNHLDELNSKKSALFFNKQRVIVVDGNQGVEEVAKECKFQLMEFMKEIGVDDRKNSISKSTKDDTPCKDIVA